jgi:hypothetical protein
MVNAVITPTEFISSLPIGGRELVTSDLARQLRILFGADGVSVLMPTPDRWAVESAARTGRVAHIDRPRTPWRSCHEQAAVIAPVCGGAVGSSLALLKIYRSAPFGTDERRLLSDLAAAAAVPIRDADAFDELLAPL